MGVSTHAHQDQPARAESHEQYADSSISPRASTADSSTAGSRSSTPPMAETDVDGKFKQPLHRQDSALSIRWSHFNEIDYEELAANVPETSLFVFGRKNPLRKTAIYIITSRYFDMFILAMIIANCVTLAMYSHQPGFDHTQLGQNLESTEYFFLAVFSLEMALKILAMGFVLAPGTYLRSGWNVLDGVVVALGYVDAFLAGSSVTALRAVRVLRPLRTITHIKGLRVPVLTLLHALPMLSDVAVLCLFALFVFGIIAVQLFAGVLRNRCAAADFSTAYLDNSTGVYLNVSYQLPLLDPNQQCSGYHAKEVTWSALPSLAGSSNGSNNSVSAFWSGGFAGNGWTCPASPSSEAPYGMFCAAFENPNGGMTSFDNVLWAWLTIFQCITQEGWTDVMYWMQDALSPWVLLYFVVLIITGSFFLINLALAVLYLQFTKEFSVVPVARAALTRSASLAAASFAADAASFTAGADSQGPFDEADLLPAQRHTKTTADSYDDDFAAVPGAVGASSISNKHSTHRVEWGQLAGETVNSNSEQQTGKQDIHGHVHIKELGDADGYVTAEVMLTNRSTSATTAPAPARTAQVHEFKTGAKSGKSSLRMVPQHLMEPGQQPYQHIHVFRCFQAVATGVQQCCIELIYSGWFSLFTMIVILANTAVMAAASYPEDPEWTHVSEYLNMGFTFYFVFELLVKLIGLGPKKYMKDRMNQFDAAVVLASLVEIGFLLAPGEDSSASSMSVLRVTRLMRIFKLARSWKELNRIISAVTRSFSQVCYLSLLLLLFVYIIALMGMQLFGYKFSGCTIPGSQQFCPPGVDCPSYPDCYVPCSSDQVSSWFIVPGSPYNGVAYCEQFPRIGSNWGNATAAEAAPTGNFSYWAQVGKAVIPNSRFDNIGWALLAVFQLVTTENWNSMMYSGMSATSPFAALWFIAAIIIGNYVLLNLFLAVLLENFGSAPGDDGKEGNKSRSLSNGSTLAAAAKAAIMLSWMKDMLESSWIAKLVNGQSYARIHPRDSNINNCDQDVIELASSRRGLTTVVHSYKGPEQPCMVGSVGGPVCSHTANQHDAVHQVDDGWMSARDDSVTAGIHGSSTDMPEPRKFNALVAPPAKPRPKLHKVGKDGVFAVMRSGGSVPRFSMMPNKQLASGPGVAPSSDSYSAALLQGNMNLLLARQPDVHGGVTSGIQSIGSIGSIGDLRQQQGQQCATLADVPSKPAMLPGPESRQRLSSGASGNWDGVNPNSSIHAGCTHISNLHGRSCFIFGPGSWLRQQLAWIITHKQFENIILMLIFLSSITLALEMPDLDHDGAFYTSLETIDMIFVVLFALEAAMKIIVKGFVLNGAGSYMRNPWNILDFLIVVIGVMMMAVTLSGGDIHSLSSLRALRTLRALRPLRVASRLEGMKVVVDALFATLPPLGNILLVCLLFYLVFGIMAVHLLSGRLYSCQDPNGNMFDAHYVLPPGQHITKEWCEDATLQVTTSAYHAGINVTLPAYAPERVWVNRIANFDNIFMAILTLFQISTTELWVNTMYDSVAAVGVDQQPRDNYNPAIAVFFVVFIIFGGFFVLQLFIATALEQFAKMQQEKGRRVLLTLQQEEWITIQRMIADTKLKVQPVPLAHSTWRTAVFRFVTSTECELLVMAVIILNVLAMALTHADMNDTWQAIMSYANVGFTAFFTMEALLKFIAFGLKQYLRDSWCRFDLIVVLVSIGGVCVDLATEQNLEVLPLLRVLRLVRVFRLIPKAEGLHNLLQTLIYSLPALGNIGGVLLLFFFIYAVVGMNLFGAVKPGMYLTRHANFSNVGMALLLLFRMITGESWNGIMQDCMNTKSCMEILKDVTVNPDGEAPVKLAAGTWLDADNPLLDQLSQDVLDNHCSPAPLAAVIYFCSFVLLCGLVLVNFVIGVIIDNMQSSNFSEDMPISRSHVDRFVRVWSELDPTASGYIPAVDLSIVVRELPPPVGIKGEEAEQAKVQSIIMSIDIPCRKKNQIHFLETLHALAGRVAGTMVPQAAEVKVHQKMYSRLPIPPADPQDGPKYTVAHFYAALYVQAAVRGFLRRHALKGVSAASGYQSINLRALGVLDLKDDDEDADAE